MRKKTSINNSNEFLPSDVVLWLTHILT